MNNKIKTNSQLSTIESRKQKQTKQTTRTRTESQILRSFGGLPVGRGKGENRGKAIRVQKHNLVGPKQTGEVKNSTGNGEKISCI